METKPRKGGKRGQLDLPIESLPKADEAEAGITCVAVNQPDFFVAQMNEKRFSTADIFCPLERAVCETVIHQVASNGSCDIRVIYEKVRERLPEVEFYKISDFYTLGCIPSALGEMFEIVRSTAKRRALLSVAYQLQHDIADSGINTAQLIQSASMEIDGLSRELAPPKSQDLNNLIVDAVNRYQTGDDSSMRILTGFDGIDNLCPLRYGDFLVIGGETKSGKTIFSLNIIGYQINQTS